MFENKNVLVLSVGGSPQPLTTCIEEIKPDIVYFIHSEESLKSVNEVIDKVSFEFEYVLKLIKNPESLQDSFNSAREVLLELNKKEYNIHIDFTGGTKPMVGGLILASTGDKYVDSCEYSYVGSVSMECNESNITSRDKDGVGIVKDGFECVKPQKDPYETYAILEFNRGKNFFDHYQFESALKNFQEAESKLEDSNLKILANFYIKLVNFYHSWDKFNSKIELFNEELNKNETFKLSGYLKKEIIDKYPEEFINDFENSSEFLTQLENNLNFLRLKLSSDVKKSIKYYLPDLLNNAYRKIEEGYYDDAVARLYRAIELIAQLNLNELNLIDESKLKSNKVFHINRKQFNLESMDKSGVQEKVSRWNAPGFEERNKTFKLALAKSFHLLSLFDVQLARDYFADKNLEDAVKNKRNNSILAHGLEPLSKESSITFYEKVLEFSIKFWPELEKYMDLAKFPKFKN